ncbi:flagellar hook protein FlgE [Rhodocyclus tenuis]|uniref:Flagellar hook protein FlgE n=2 Tax=Rhodocyclus TaxID=1064 RepID=A0A6L5JX06_RHOTE|nr:flagellar hook protein FlgE [Rhodocyclus gracilis]MQY51606.1 flagellar hook-basal body complex protein [Rhodocyclus gracilis]MRD73088.1 flagellar hook-basal body complex protein [Rhodocyclus gracilis]NJA89134.1 flagellar hook protein FlgE [Rhodocyclus gracilis]
MAFQQGLSGLNASSMALDVIGNNVANSSTVGFKAANAHFADVYANSLGGSGATQVGIGTSIAAVQQQFTQGNLTSTSNPLDIAINGNGFFCMSTANSALPSYTRNGQFHVDKMGYIINDQKQQLMGFAALADGTVPVAGTLTALNIPPGTMAPRSTDAALSGNMTAVLNLDSRQGVPTVATFDPSNPQSYNYSTPLTVYDTLGNSHAMTMYFARASAGGPWNVYATLDGVSATTPPTAVGTLTFNSSGVLTTTPTTLTMPSWTLSTGAVSPWSPGKMDFAGTTQFGSTFSRDRVTQGGYTTGSLTGVSVAADGTVQGNYSNSQTKGIGRVALATFQNPNGLLSMGNNQWQAVEAVSGQANIQAPGAGNSGLLQSTQIEESNVDLTKELVNMITQQRNYQANAQSIKTQDQIMQTLVNLR